MKDSGGTVPSLRTYAQDMAAAGALPEQTTAAKKPAATAVKSPASDTKHTPLPAPQPKSEIAATTPPPFSSVTDKASPTTVVQRKNKSTQKTTIPAKATRSLDQEVAEITHVKTKKPSVLTAADDVVGHADGTAGTVITDTKHKRFRLLPAIWDALTGWLKTKQKEIAAEHRPRHTVADAAKRAAIIDSATKESATVARENYDQIATQLKQKERTATNKPLQLKEKTDVPEPSWSHLLDDDAISVVDPVVIDDISDTNPKPAPAPAPAVSPVVDAVSPVRMTTDQTNETVTEENSTLHTTPAELVDEVIPDPQPTPTITTPAPETDTVSTQIPTPPSQTVAAPPVTRHQSPETTTASPFSAVAVVLVIVVALVGGVGSAVWYFGGLTNEDTTTALTIPANFASARQLALPFTDTRTVLMQRLADRTNTAPAVTQLYFSRTVDGTESIIDSAEILDVLALTNAGSLVRSIDTISFGATEDDEPFIVLSVTSFDAAFAGILNWEQTMSADLTPFFGQTVTSTFNPNSRSSAGLTAPFFVDQIHSNNSLRILYDETGAERITYGFVNTNTIVITTTRSAFDTIKPLVQ